MDLSKSQLTINHLKMVCELDRCETVKEAAKTLFITQPALTNRIREAERRLNTKLFVQRGRKLIISNAGKRLLHSAKKILEELARAEYDIARLTDGIEQVVRLGLPHYSSFKWLPKAMASFNETMPNIELEITSEAAIEPLSALYSGDVDMAMISSASKKLSLDKSSYQSVFILEDELIACLSTAHKKAQKKYLNAEDFSEEVYVTNSTVPEKDREYELFFKPKNVLPRKVLQVGFNEAIIELVKGNLGISIFSKRQIESFSHHKDIKTIKLGKTGLKIYWHLVYLNQPSILEPADMLVDLLHQQNNKG